MRISDWSSDVCSSDLFHAVAMTARRQWFDQIDHDLPDPGFQGLHAVCGERLFQQAPQPRVARRIAGDDVADEAAAVAVHDFGQLVDKPVGIAILVAMLQRIGERIRSEEHTSELQSLMRNSYAVFCLKTKQQIKLKSQT